MATGKFRTGLDAFYTKPEIAVECVRRLIPWIQEVPLWIEPSAGAGAFVDAMKGYPCQAYDIAPAAPGIIQQDFLTLEIPEGCGLVGNPPFGSQSCLARRFLHHGMQHANIVAFILPRSFTKPSMQTCIPRNFHCVHEWELPPDSFEIQGKSHHVPCVFQIWKRQDTPREIPASIPAEGFTYVSATDPYQFAIRRVGGNAGRAYLPGDLAPQSHYFVQTEVDPAPLMEKLNAHVFPSNTTGPRSLSKSEINAVLNPWVAEAARA